MHTSTALRHGPFTRFFTLCRHRCRLLLAALCTTLCLTVASGGILAPAAQAQDLADQARSLRFVPADAAFYSGSLRMKEQWDAFTASQTYMRLMQMPLVQMGLMQAQFQWQQSDQEPLPEIRQFVQSPEGQEAIALIKEMFSDEFFVYGGGEFATLLEVYLEAAAKLQAVQLEAAQQTLGGPQDIEELMERQLRELVAEHGERVRVPDLVFGFRIQDAARATAHLDKLEQLATAALAGAPPEVSALLADRLQREQIGGNDFLTLRLDGGMLPWDEIRADAPDISDEDFDQWQELASGKTLAVAVGLAGDFLILSVGDSTEHIAQFGQGETITGNPHFARLNAHADQRVASIGYASDELMKMANSPRYNMQQLVTMADMFIEMGDFPEEHRTLLREDARKLTDALIAAMPEPGALAAVSLLTPRGYEGFAYRFTSRALADDSAPLDIPARLGSGPVGFIASRTRQSLEDYDRWVALLTEVAQNAETVAQAKLPPEAWAQYLLHRERAVDLLNRLHVATREQCIPALAGGEQALVLDIASTSRQWFAMAPPANQPLPMLELGLLLEVSDAERLRAGVEEYFSIAQATIDFLHDLNPEEIPPFQLPPPEERPLEGGGVMAAYPLPEHWGVDRQVAPNAGTTETHAAASLLPAFTERLLGASEPEAIDTPIDLNRPAAAVVHFEIHKLFSAIGPWVDYGFMAAQQMAQAEGDGNQAQNALMMGGMIVPQVHQALDVLGAIRSYSSVTYEQDGAWVTHSELHVSDP